MAFNVHHISFSRRGAYFVLSWIDDNLFIRNIHGGDARTGKLFAIHMLNGEKNILPYTVSFEAHRLLLESKNAIVNIVLTKHSIVISGKNCILCLDAVLGKYDHLNMLSSKMFELHSYSNELKTGITILKGTAILHATWKSTGQSSAKLELHAIDLPSTPTHNAIDQHDTAMQEDFTLVMEEYTVTSPHNVTLQYTQGYTRKVQEANKQEYHVWKERLLKGSDIANKDMSELASYILWSSIVDKKGILPYDAMYMSKNWMTNIWSWDNCYNAICLAKHFPELAYQQFIFFKPLQHGSGALPDFANNVFASYSCVKPPVQGWAYMLMMQQNSFFTQKNILQESYDMLAKIHNYWTTQRVKKYPLPYYNHGNDSGWDNATVFDRGCPVICPDVTAYLILLQEALSTIAHMLHKKQKAQQWQNLAQEYQEKLLSILFNGNEFFSLLYSNGEKIYSKSLLHLMPIVIGHRLPNSVLNSILQTLLSSNFLSAFGIASEAFSSSYYQSNGYWRGCIWPLTTLPIIDSLQRCGHKDKAKDIALRFMKLIHTSMTMAENFDALEGKGLNDLAFSFTASTYIYIQNTYYKNK